MTGMDTSSTITRTREIIAQAKKNRKMPYVLSPEDKQKLQGLLPTKASSMPWDKLTQTKRALEFLRYALAGESKKNCHDGLKDDSSSLSPDENSLKKRISTNTNNNNNNNNYIGISLTTRNQSTYSNTQNPIALSVPSAPVWLDTINEATDFVEEQAIVGGNSCNADSIMQAMNEISTAICSNYTSAGYSVHCQINSHTLPVTV